MNVEVREPKQRQPWDFLGQSHGFRESSLVVPGQIITKDTGFMRGHGTYTEGDQLLASIPGVVEQHNKLMCARPLNSRYNGEVGDVVVGRIVELGIKRWKVETRSRLQSILMLSSINLPGGVLRRRSAEDELMMRQYLKEGDLISAEVQSIYSSGVLSLHTRSLKYGKLGQGTLVQVSPSLIKRCKTHFHNLPCGAMVIIGHNGYIWISPLVSDEEARAALAETEAGQRNMSSHSVGIHQVVNQDSRETIARLRNCILALATQRQLIFDTTIIATYETSIKYTVKELTKPEVIEEITISALSAADQ